MAFIRADLTHMAYGAGHSIWYYTSADAPAVVDTAGYFNSAADQINVGDFLFVRLSTGGTPSHGLMVVSSNAAGVVDVNDLLAINTDTD